MFIELIWTMFPDTFTRATVSMSGIGVRESSVSVLARKGFARSGPERMGELLQSVPASLPTPPRKGLLVVALVSVGKERLQSVARLLSSSPARLSARWAALRSQ